VPEFAPNETVRKGLWEHELDQRCQKIVRLNEGFRARFPLLEVGGDTPARTKEHPMNFRPTRTLSLLAAATLIGLAAPAARAGSYVVTSILDAGPGTLRAAVDAANATSGADTISFHPSLNGTIQLSSIIYVGDALTIIGAPDGSIGFNTSGSFQPFAVLSTVGDFGLIDLHFQNCAAAISLHGHVRLNLQRCSFIENGSSSTWGGVINQAPTNQYRLSGIVQSCSFVGNVGLYAGVVVSAPPLGGETLDFVNCTICGNTGTAGAGVYNIFSNNPANTGTIRVINSTVTGNTSSVNAGVPSGAFHLFAPIPGAGVSLLVRNSIVAENTPGSAQSDPNFSGFPAQSLSLVGANVFSDAQLAPLSQVAGRHVRIPLLGSPCIDSATPDSMVRADQLGTLRPFLAPGAVPAVGSNGADIGAIEFVPSSCPADFDGSGTVAVPDIFAFLSSWFAGCP